MSQCSVGKELSAILCKRFGVVPLPRCRQLQVQLFVQELKGSPTMRSQAFESIGRGAARRGGATSVGKMYGGGWRMTLDHGLEDGGCFATSRAE